VRRSDSAPDLPRAVCFSRLLAGTANPRYVCQTLQDPRASFSQDDAIALAKSGCLVDQKITIVDSEEKKGPVIGPEDFIWLFAKDDGEVVTQERDATDPAQPIVCGLNVGTILALGVKND